MGAIDTSKASSAILDYAAIARGFIREDGGELCELKLGEGFSNICIYNTKHTRNGEYRKLVVPSIVYHSEHDVEMEGLKVCVGHEFCHAAFGIESQARAFSNFSGEEANREKSITSILIESACDSYGAKLYNLIHGDIPVESYATIRYIFDPDQTNPLRSIKLGYLPVEHRLVLMCNMHCGRIRVADIFNHYCNVWEKYGKHLVNRNDIYEYIMNHPMKKDLEQFLYFNR